MLFNNDSVFVLGAVVVLGIFTYTFYNNIMGPTTTVTDTPIYKEVGVQTESLVNTMAAQQPNIDSMNLAESAYPVLQPNNLHLIDVGVQTPANSIFSLFKDWLMELFSISSSQIPTPAEVRIENWLDNLNSSQVVSTPTMNSVVSESNLQGVEGLSSIVFNSHFDISIYNIEILNKYLETPANYIDTSTINGLTYYVLMTNDAILTIDPGLIIMNPLFI